MVRGHSRQVKFQLGVHLPPKCHASMRGSEWQMLLVLQNCRSGSRHANPEHSSSPYLTFSIHTCLRCSNRQESLSDQSVQEWLTELKAKAAGATEAVKENSKAPA